MAKVVFIEADGTRRNVDAKEGFSLMLSARKAVVQGILAECSGAAMCATCHCYVLETPGGPLPAIQLEEAETIKFTAHKPLGNSRLTCQIKVMAALEGAVFQVATGQL